MSFKNVFDEESVLLKGLQLRINFKLNELLIFYKARPFSLYQNMQVEKELEIWGKCGVIEKFNFSEWATPIVYHIKKDESVSVCADLSIMLNPRKSIDIYPLPRIEELFTRLVGGKTFSVIDIASAYLQIE
ncbi:hypothetical protein RF11_15451 [Thelohanellus kitauei]|uniref:Uncharacterized protein n=1 Tax=Thelohanellus kitauei TaxID=669202 RepID=A0A0C2NM02_THEKT|nr:hypothetical protein RF11_15451 [Thelohanellus kitauei]